MLTKGYSIAALMVDIKGDDRYKAVHAIYLLIKGFSVETITELVMLVEPSGNISLELFELCHDGLKIAKHIEMKKSTIPDQLPEGVGHQT